VVDAAPFGRRRSLRSVDGDPLALLVGLFDGALVLALAVALQVGGAAPDHAVPEQHEALPRYQEAAGRAAGDGSRLGIAYRLGNGEVVFVPDQREGDPPRPNR
jgi:hypothetical protein